MNSIEQALNELGFVTRKEKMYELWRMAKRTMDIMREIFLTIDKLENKR